MENSIDCTVSNHSSNRSILYPLEKNSCMGSDMPSVPFGHAPCRRKTTEL
jgi:hypothetical protein